MLTLLLCMPIASIYAADADPTFYASEVAAKAGTDVQVEIGITNNPGIIAYRLRIGYDPAVLTLKNAVAGVLPSTFGPLVNQPFTLSWGDAIHDDYTTNGVIATLTFTVAEDAPTADTAITITYDEDDVYKTGYDNVHFETKAGKVSVTAKPVAVTGVTIDQTLSLDLNETKTPTYTVMPENATNKAVSFRSDDPAVATVDTATGAVTGVSEGKTSITVTTADGNLKAVCAVTVACGHKSTKSVPEEKSTCIKQGHGAYTVCNTCGRVISGSDQKLPLADHTMTEKAETDYRKSAATCVAPAVYYKSCAVCGAKSTETFSHGAVDATNHTHTELRDAKDATCKDPGYTGDIWCKDCSKKLQSGQVKPATGAHVDADGKWESNANQHFHTCSCGTQFDFANHEGGEATCAAQAVCTVCGAAYGEKNADNHKHTELRDAKDATCKDPGYTGDTWCKDCSKKLQSGQVKPATGAHVDADGKWESNANQHFHTCNCGTQFGFANHEGGEATCSVQAVCTVCGAAYGEKNADNHKRTELRDEKAATEQEKGYTGDTWCLDCNKKIAEGADIDVLEHKPTQVEAKPATVTETGNIEYYYCANCGKYFSDAQGTKEISPEETILKKLPPEIIEGNNAAVYEGEKKALSFRSNAAFADFIRVELDGKALDEKDYTKADGSILVTLNADLVSTLSVGEHTIGIVSESGTATAKFTVKANGGSAGSPKTGDGNSTVVWSLMAVVSLAAFGAIAVASRKKRVR